MTATTIERDTDCAGLVPARATLDMAANVLAIGGTIACRDANGRGTPPVSGTANPALGKWTSDFDNRTTAPEGGAAGAIVGEVEHGIFGWYYTGSPIPGQRIYVVDNQTVSPDSAGGTLGYAGRCTEVRNGLCYVYMGPDAAGEELTGQVSVPLSSFRVAAGTVPAAFNDGVSDGFVVSEGVMYRFNVSSTAPIWGEVALPQDLDTSQDMVVHILASREGTDDVTAAVTVAAFFQVDGAAYDADADAGGDTSAVDGAATKEIAEVTLTIAAANIPANPSALGFSLVPTAALDADDLNIHAVWLEYTRL